MRKSKGEGTTRNQTGRNRVGTLGQKSTILTNLNTQYRKNALEWGRVSPTLYRRESTMLRKGDSKENKGGSLELTLSTDKQNHEAS